jgi:branched-chain amino acid transport system permease protein
MGNIWGAIAGALTITYVDKTLLPWIGQRMQEFGRTIDNDTIASINPASFNFLIFGVILVLMMRFRPEGVFPSRQRAAELHEAPPTEAIGSTAVVGTDATIEEQLDAEPTQRALAAEAPPDADDEGRTPGSGP